MRAVRKGRFPPSGPRSDCPRPCSRRQTSSIDSIVDPRCVTHNGQIKIPEEIPENNRGSELHKGSPIVTDEAMHDTYLDEMAARLRVKPATLQYWASRRLIPA